MSTALRLYDEALREPAGRLWARRTDGSVHELPIDRWRGAATPGDESVLGRVAGPALDVGCGPGRHLEALARRGIEALGVDISAGAVRLARDRGARAVAASIFDPLPAPGPWRTALLLDGNVGIGGEPTLLLRRLSELLRGDGRVLLELEAPGTPVFAGALQLEARRRRSEPFPWASVGIDGAPALAAAAGYVLDEAWQSERRWFAALSRRPRGR